MERARFFEVLGRVPKKWLIHVVPITNGSQHNGVRSGSRASRTVISPGAPRADAEGVAVAITVQPGVRTRLGPEATVLLQA